MKLTTIGLGYIGLPTAIMFAKHGIDVLGVDIKEKAVNLLNSGKIHIDEPGLQEALDEVLSSGKFRASTQPEVSDVYIIAVPTPNKDDEYKSCDISILMKGLESIVSLIKPKDTIIIESTIAPRTMNDFVAPFIKEQGFEIGKDIYLVHCPERVLPGQIMHELVYNNRIIGGITPNCTEAGKKVYSTFVKGEMIETDAKTAEMSKLMENTYRDVNIALANELTKVCNRLNINVNNVIEMANKHPRVSIHTPGPGVGGHCLAVDPYFIIAEAPEESKIIQLAREVNISMPDYVVDYTKSILEKVDGDKVTVFGLTYKGDVDDIRESPALEIYEKLRKESDIEVVAYDPHVELDFVEKDLSVAVQESSLVLVLSDHSDFKNLNASDLYNMKNKVIFDTKNLVPSSLEEVKYLNYGNIQNLNKLL